MIYNFRVFREKPFPKASPKEGNNEWGTRMREERSLHLRDVFHWGARSLRHTPRTGYKSRRNLLIDDRARLPTNFAENFAICSHVGCICNLIYPRFADTIGPSWISQGIFPPFFPATPPPISWNDKLPESLHYFNDLRDVIIFTRRFFSCDLY